MEINGIVKNKYGTTEYWSNNDIIPLVGEIVIYSDGFGEGKPAIKVGDGKTKLSDLPFIKADDNSPFYGIDYIIEEENNISTRVSWVKDGETTIVNNFITWSYRKWNSGIAECWGYTNEFNYNSANYPDWKVEGDKTTIGEDAVHIKTFYGAGMVYWYPSNLFVSKPVPSVIYDTTGGGIAVPVIAACNSSNLTIGLSSVNAVGRTGLFYITARGRWK